MITNITVVTEGRTSTISVDSKWIYKVTPSLSSDDAAANSRVFINKARDEFHHSVSRYISTGTVAANSGASEFVSVTAFNGGGVSTLNSNYIVATEDNTTYRTVKYKLGGDLRDFDVTETKAALDSAIDAAQGGSALTNSAWADSAGSDASAVVGSISQPYGTIQGAIDAVAALSGGGTVEVSPDLDPVTAGITGTTTKVSVKFAGQSDIAYTGTAGLINDAGGATVLDIDFNQNTVVVSGATSDLVNISDAGSNVVIRNAVFDLSAVTSAEGPLSITAGSVSFGNCTFLNTSANPTYMANLSLAGRVLFDNPKFVGPALTAPGGGIFVDDSVGFTGNCSIINGAMQLGAGCTSVTGATAVNVTKQGPLATTVGKDASVTYVGNTTEDVGAIVLV